mmetsp:Transcript_1979/g.5323  ORF Transcript_1979/g.5323 Transcript_1979/m.5323 type:complete len:286 (+) Transcript_1979:139-996(+)
MLLVTKRLCSTAQVHGGIETLNRKSTGLCAGLPMTRVSPWRRVSRPTRRPFTKVPLSDSQSWRITASSSLTITACLLETMLGTSELSRVRLQDFGFRPITKSPFRGTCTTSLVCWIRWTMQPQGWQVIRRRFFKPWVASKPDAPRRIPAAGTFWEPTVHEGAFWEPAVHGGACGCVDADAGTRSPRSCGTVHDRWSDRLEGAGRRNEAARTVPCTSMTPQTSSCQPGSELPLPRPLALAFFTPLTNTVNSILGRAMRSPTRSPTASSFKGRHCFVLIFETSVPCT